MFQRFIVSAAAFVALASAPTFAATPKIWYVAQNVKTSVCIVTPTKPNGTTYMMVGTDTFPTAAAASKSMKVDSECKTAAVTTTSTKPSTSSKPSTVKSTTPTTSY